MTITLYDHPLSPYGQKVKIALREKGVPFETVSPGGLGAGGAAGAFAEANPRAEVPTLVDGEVAVFDSTVMPPKQVTTIKARDCVVRYRRDGKVLAVASIYRDVDSLKEELAMQRRVT